MASTKTQAVATLEMGKTEIEQIVSFNDVMAEIQHRNVPETVVILNPYETLNQNKDALLDTPFIIRAVKFQADAQTGAEYLNMWCVTQDDKLYRVTDGSTGIYAQVDALVTARLQSEHPTPYNYFVIPNGLRKSEFGIDAEHKTVKLGDPTMVSKAATYYLA